MSKVKIVGETTTDKQILEHHVITLIKMRLNKIKRDIEDIDKDLGYFSKKFNMKGKTFLEKFNKGLLDDDEDYFVWEGSINIKAKLLEEQNSLSEIV